MKTVQDSKYRFRLVQSVALMVTVCLGLTNATPARALDVPEGGDALFHQLRASSLVAVGSFQARTPTGALQFKTLSSVVGELGTAFTVQGDTYTNGLPLKQGVEVIVFMKGKGLIGPILRPLPYTLATSINSIQPFDSRFSGDLKLIVADIQKVRGDKRALKETLMKWRDHASSYIQESVVLDLINHTVFEAQDAALLGQTLQAGKLSSLEARLEIIRQLEKFKLNSFNGFLVKLVSTENESVALKVAALDVLGATGDQASLRQLATVVGNGQSLRLKERYIGHLK